MNYERSNSRKQGHVELMLYNVLCTLTNSIEMSSKSRVRVDLRALVRSLLSMRRPVPVQVCLSMRRLSREYRTAGEIIETRPEVWCDQKQTLEGQTDTNRPS